MGRGAREKDTEVQSLKLRVEDVLGWVAHRVDLFSEPLRRVLPTGKVYPLPTSISVLSSIFPQELFHGIHVFRALVLGLNSMNGEGLENNSDATSFQRKMLSNLVSCCVRVLQWKAEDEVFSWEDFWKIRGIDYKGDEVLTAQKISWESIAPALPAEVGGVPLVDLVKLGTLHYVENSSDFLLDPADQKYVRPPRVMVDQCDWDSLCANLLSKGVFSKMHEDDIYRVDDKPLLNGLFGVSKNEFTEQGVEIMRLIMNLVPVNAISFGQRHRHFAVMGHDATFAP